MIQNRRDRSKDERATRKRLYDDTKNIAVDGCFRHLRIGHAEYHGCALGHVRQDVGQTDFYAARAQYQIFVPNNLANRKLCAQRSGARHAHGNFALRHHIRLYKCNKFETLGLHPKRARSIDSYVLGECGLIAEFKVIAVIDPENIESKIDGLFASKRPHSLFIGEIADCYKLK